jgi:hypothetical protein
MALTCKNHTVLRKKFNLTKILILIHENYNREWLTFLRGNWTMSPASIHCCEKCVLLCNPHVLMNHVVVKSYCVIAILLWHNDLLFIISEYCKRTLPNIFFNDCRCANINLRQYLNWHWWLYQNTHAPKFLHLIHASCFSPWLLLASLQLVVHWYIASKQW